MLDLIKKSFEAALGVASITQEKLKELADELVLKGYLSKKEGEDILKTLKNTANESQKKIGSFVEEQVRKIMKEMSVATSSEIKALKGKIEKLEKELAMEKEKKGATKKAAPKSKKGKKE